MESSFFTGDVAAISAAPTSQDVRKRWLLLALALVVGLVAAFAIGSAVKKSSPPAAPAGSLVQSSSASGQHATITPLASAVAVPALHAPPQKPKTKPKTNPSTSAASTSSSSVATTSVSSASTQSSAPVVSTPAVQSAPTTSHSAGSTSSSGGISHGGGAGQNAG